MGHTRLGNPPKTRQWRELVSLMAGDGDDRTLAGVPLTESVDSIAAKTLDASEAALKTAANDQGLRYAFYLLTQLVLSARTDDWRQSLSGLGIKLSADAAIFDLAAELQYNIDDYLATHARPTDISEMAHGAIGEAIIEVAGPRSETLFGSGSEEIRIAMRELSTKKGFSELAQAFFASFLFRFLNFHLSRVTAAQTGIHRLQHVGDLTRFNDALKLHCRQSSFIVRDFCGQWYSKTQWEQGINLENASGFMAVALKKLEAELERQGAA